MAEGRKLSGIWEKGTNPTQEASALPTDHFPNAPPLNTITLGIRLQHRNFGGTQAFRPVAMGEHGSGLTSHPPPDSHGEAQSRLPEVASGSQGDLKGRREGRGRKQEKVREKEDRNTQILTRGRGNSTLVILGAPARFVTRCGFGPWK